MSRYAETDSQRYLWHLQQVRRKKRARRREADIDADAAAYIAAVEAEDGEPLEPAIAAAYDDFVRGCKDDGIWDAIKASCIMAGARTLSGALVPLKGAAPTNFNFVPTDYDRVTGLKADGGTKYLDSNRNNNADPQNNAHLSVYATTLQQSGVFASYIGSRSGGSVFNENTHVSRSGVDPENLLVLSRGGGDSGSFSFGVNQGSALGFIGKSREAPEGFKIRGAGFTTDHITSSLAPSSRNVHVFGRNAEQPARSNARLSFYSIGEALDLEALDARVTALMTAIDEALS